MSTVIYSQSSRTRSHGIVMNTQIHTVLVCRCSAIHIWEYRYHCTATQLAQRDLLSHLIYRANTDSARTSTRHNEPERQEQKFVWRIISAHKRGPEPQDLHSNIRVHHVSLVRLVPRLLIEGIISVANPHRVPSKYIS